MDNKVLIDRRLCKGCGICVVLCPRKILLIDEGEIKERGTHEELMADEDGLYRAMVTKRSAIRGFVTQA